MGSSIIAAFKAATGGPAYDNLKTYHQVTTVTAQAPMGPLDITVDQTVQLPDHMYLVTTFPFGKQTQVIAGEKGWTEGMGKFQDMTEGQVIGAQTKIQEDTLSILYRADELEFQALEPVEIRGKNCIPVVVSVGSGKTVMFIDQATNFLVMVQRPSMSPVTGNPVTQKTYIGEYQEMDGFMMPRTLEVTHDDEDFADIEVITFEVNHHLDQSLFIK